MKLDYSLKFKKNLEVGHYNQDRTGTFLALKVKLIIYKSQI